MPNNGIPGEKISGAKILDRISEDFGTNQLWTPNYGQAACEIRHTPPLRGPPLKSGLQG